MGLSHYPSAAEGMLPILVMNTVISVALLKSMIRWVLQVMGCVENNHELQEEEAPNQELGDRKISVTRFNSICTNGSRIARTTSGVVTKCGVECCVCLKAFEGDEQVSELSCKHFFHKACLGKWLDHNHTTCPLCRSTFC